jgi:hypothetical protein
MARIFAEYKIVSAWMNENEWMNGFHSVMQPFNHSKLFCSGLSV